MTIVSIDKFSGRLFLLGEPIQVAADNKPSVIVIGDGDDRDSAKGVDIVLSYNVVTSVTIAMQ